MSREIAFIDQSIPDLEHFVSGLRPGLEAILLSPKQEAPAQIADQLRGRAGLDAIHIVAHGAPGAIGFASGPLTVETVKEHAADLASIGDALTPDGELLIWACETGKGARGEAFIAALEDATGASIAGATSLVGSVAQGGCWALDAGSSAVRPPLTEVAAASYAGVLVEVGVPSSSSYTENGSNGVSIFTGANVSVGVFEFMDDITVSIVGYNGTERLSGGSGSSWNSSTGVLTISLATGAGSEAYTNALRSVTYIDFLNDNPSTTRSISVVATSTTDTDSTSQTINITRVNDAPTATITPTTYTAVEQGVLNLKGAGLAIADVDANSGSMTVTLSVASGTLSAAAGDSGAGVVGNGTSSLTLTGTLAQVNALLAAGGSSTLSFLGDGPGSATLTLAVNDEGNTSTLPLVPKTASDTATINVLSLQEAPKATVTFDDAFLSELFWSSSSLSAITKTSTNFTFSTTPPFGGFGTLYVKVTGTGLTYSGDNPADGTYTSIAVFSDPGLTTQIASYNAATPVDFATYFSAGATAALAGKDTITGSSEADIIVGRSGVDTLDGKDSDDQYFFLNGDVAAGEIISDTGASGTDVIVASGSVDFTGATTIAGIEALGFSQQSAAQTAILNGSQFSAGQLPANLEVTGNNQGVDTIVVQNASNFTAVGWTFTGWTDSDLLAIDGTAGNDALTGSSAKDSITGKEGADTLTGGLGADVLNGGTGTDTASYAGSAAVTVSLATGGPQATGGAGSDTLIGIENLIGSSFADTLTGNTAANVLNGGVGADTLIGGAGADIQNGGDGNDIFQIAGTEGNGDTFVGGIGTDKIQVTGSAAVTLAGFVKTNSVEQWVGNGKGVLGTSSDNTFDFSALTSGSTLGPVDGGSGNDKLTGSLSADKLLGGSGNDTLLGGAHNDILTGGTGKDSLTGGANKDIFDFNSTKESVKGGNRDKILDFSRGQGDRIDLSGIDADTSANAGNDVFKFIGTAAFKGGGGELRCSNGVVQADVNGDKVADFEIFVNISSMKSGDFVL